MSSNDMNDKINCSEKRLYTVSGAVLFNKDTFWSILTKHVWAFNSTQAIEVYLLYCLDNKSVSALSLDKSKITCVPIETINEK